MIAVEADGRGVEALPPIVDALVEAASHDPYLEGLGVHDPSHCHGWGYAASIRRQGSWDLLFGKGDAGDCGRNLDDLARAVGQLKASIYGADAAMLLLHARRAGREEPRGPMHAHPYAHAVQMRDGPLHLFLEHNGSVRKDALAEELGLDASAYTDSHLSLIWLASKLGGDPLRALSEVALSYTRTAYDAALLEVGREGPRLHVIGYVRREGLDATRAKYYEPLIARGHGVVGYVSSTVRDVLDLGRAMDVEFEPIWNRGLTLGPGGILRSIYVH